MPRVDLLSQYMDEASPARQFKRMKRSIARLQTRGAARGFSVKNETVLGKAGGTIKIKGKLVQDA